MSGAIVLESGTPKARPSTEDKICGPTLKLLLVSTKINLIIQPPFLKITKYLDGLVKRPIAYSIFIRIIFVTPPHGGPWLEYPVYPKHRKANSPPKFCKNVGTN